MIEELANLSAQRADDIAALAKFVLERYLAGGQVVQPEAKARDVRPRIDLASEEPPCRLGTGSLDRASAGEAPARGERVPGGRRQTPDGIVLLKQAPLDLSVDLGRPLAVALNADEMDARPAPLRLRLRQEPAEEKKNS
jgi:hypothetical protein